MESQLVRVLLVEDNPVDATLVRRTLARAENQPSSFELDHASALEQALDWLGKKRHDVVLLDLNLPDSNGTETVRRVRAAEPDLAIVSFSRAAGRGAGLPGQGGDHRLGAAARDALRDGAPAHPRGEAPAPGAAARGGEAPEPRRARRRCGVRLQHPARIDPRERRPRPREAGE